MPTFVWSNNVLSTLADSVNTTQTTITLASTANFPTIPSGDQWAISLTDAATRQNIEIMYVTSISGAVLTVLRAQEGTAALSWAVGDFAYATVTAAQLTNIQEFAEAAYVELSPGSQQSGSIDVSGSITGSEFIGSGAGLTDATVPNAALVTSPVTSVTASGNLSSSGGLTPVITITDTPTFTTVTFGNGGNMGPASENVLNIQSAGGADGGGINLSGSDGLVNVFVPDAGGMANLRGPFLSGPAGVPANSNINGDISFSRVGGTEAAAFFGGDGNAAIDFDLSNGEAFSFVSAPASGTYRAVFGGTYTPSSDARFKENVADIHYGLDTVKALTGRAFTWIDSKKNDVGFIAQEVALVVPEVVSTDKKGYHGVNYSGIVPVLVKAVQELAASFESYVATHP
jgi:Chaperone of endosialidase